MWCNGMNMGSEGRKPSFLAVSMLTTFILTSLLPSVHYCFLKCKHEGIGWSLTSLSVSVTQWFRLMSHMRDLFSWVFIICIKSSDAFLGIEDQSVPW